MKPSRIRRGGGPFLENCPPRAILRASIYVVFVGRHHIMVGVFVVGVLLYCLRGTINQGPLIISWLVYPAYALDEDKIRAGVSVHLRF